MKNKMPYPLRTLFWETTLRCNAHCRFCGSSCGPDSSGDLTTDEIIGVFKSVAERMDARRIMIHVTGGEPLLREDLYEVMSECVSLGYTWGMVTNGTLLTVPVVQHLREAGLRSVSISLDGPAAVHNTLRGLPNGYEQTVHGLRLLKEQNFLYHLQVTTVVSTENILYLEAFYDDLKELGPDSWRLVMVDPIGRAREETSLLIGRLHAAAFS